MSNIQLYSAGLKRIEPNVWIPKNLKIRTTAYPKGGHANCFSIEDASFWFNHRNNSIVSTVKNYKPSGPIFDIGGGNGYVTQALFRAGFDSILVEPGKLGVKNAKTRKIPTIIQSTFQDADFYPNSIPAIGLFDVLEHIEDDGLFLRNIHSVLKPDGKLYMTVPAFPFLWSSQDIYAHHFRRYTSHSVTQTLRKANFIIDYCTYYFGIFPVPLMLFRSIPYRLNKVKNYTDSQFQKEMTQGGGILESAFKFYLDIELAGIKKRMVLPVGSSLLIVAHRDP